MANTKDPAIFSKLLNYTIRTISLLDSEEQLKFYEALLKFEPRKPFIGEMACFNVSLAYRMISDADLAAECKKISNEILEITKNNALKDDEMLDLINLVIQFTKIMKTDGHRNRIIIDIIWRTVSKFDNILKDDVNYIIELIGHLVDNVTTDFNKLSAIIEFIITVGDNKDILNDIEVMLDKRQEVLDATTNGNVMEVLKKYVNTIDNVAPLYAESILGVAISDRFGDILYNNGIPQNAILQQIPKNPTSSADPAKMLFQLENDEKIFIFEIDARDINNFRCNPILKSKAIPA